MASAVACLQPNTHSTVVRPLANFPPSIWGDHFTCFSFDNSAFERYAKEVEVLKEEVREMFMDTTVKSTVEMMNLINSLHRLGVSYLFDKEIEGQLDKFFACLNLDDYKEYDLYTISVQFRVFRQHGYKFPCDVFNKFKDSSTGRFKETLASDVKGMLSFYEATQLRIRGEYILDEAVAFTTAHLKSMVAHLSPPIAKQVNQALKRPFHKGMQRVEARLYISAYEEDEFRNELVLKLAKMDFNMLQLKHQQELHHVSKWWRDLEVSSNVSYARDRVVECYFWIVGTYFEPRFSLARIILTKIIAMASIIDDTYDAYGTIDELQLFRDTANRWDINAIDQLPEYMKFIYRMLLNLYDEIDAEMAKEGRSYGVHHARERMKELIRAYCIEAKWFNCGYIPSFDEYMKNALITSNYHMISTSSFVGMGELATEEAFEWIQNKPKIVTASETFCRLQDDLVTHEYEQKRGHVASGVQCYMKQYGVSEEEVIHEFQERISNAWKDMNEECLKPTTVPMHVLMRVLNLARVIHVIYGYEDAYTNSEKLKDYITTLFIDSIPV